MLASLWGAKPAQASNIARLLDDVRYYLELFPVEGLDLNQVYTMTMTVNEVMMQKITCQSSDGDGV